MPRRPLTQQQAALKHGWRSGLEKGVAAQLAEAGVPHEYESETLEYVEPERRRKYTPDFIITTKSGKKIIVETKGRWVRADRLKMQLVVAQHPGLDLRILFQNPRARISKGSNTTYAAWCEKHLGIPWAGGREVPQAWLDE